MRADQKESLNLTFLVNSCDLYKDVWDLFFAAYKEYADLENVKVVLNCETEKYIHDSVDVDVHNFKSKDGVDRWGERLLKTLNDIDTDFVLMVCEDFILESKLNKFDIDQCIDYMSNNLDAAVIYLYKVYEQPFKDFKKDPSALKLPKMMNYKVNSAPAIWRRKDLIQYLGKNDTPWAWEYFGSYRAYFDNKCFFQLLSPNGNVFDYNSKLGGAIYRGKWVPQVVVEKINKYNLNIDLDVRGIVDSFALPKRSLYWKVKFFITGFNMVGIGAFLFAFRMVKDKFVKVISVNKNEE